MQSLLQVSLFLLVITIGRLASIVTGVVGLISVVIGRQALTRSSHPIDFGRRKAIAALVIGLIGVALSALHLILSTGGFGTGSGRAGAIVAMVAGLIGASLGGLALARSRRMASRRSATETASFKERT